MKIPFANSTRKGPASPPGQAPGGRGGAVRRASGHNPLASAMLIMLPAVSLIFIGVFVYYSGILSDFAGPDPTQSRETIKIDTKTTTMDSPRVTRFDNKGQSYILTARTARQHADNPAVVLLDQVTIDMKLKKKLDSVSVTASRGSFNAEKKHLVLAGNIRVASSKGYRALLSSAEVFLKERRITSRQPVLISTPRGTISADSFVSTRQNVRLVGNILYDSQSGIRAWLASADANLQTGRIVSNEPVRVEMPRGTVHANGLEITDNGDHIRFFNRTSTLLNAKKKKTR